MKTKDRYLIQKIKRICCDLVRQRYLNLLKKIYKSFKFLLALTIFLFLSGCILDRSGAGPLTDKELRERSVFYSCDKDSWVLDEEQTQEISGLDETTTSRTQIVKFSALCVLRRYYSLTPLDGTFEFQDESPNTLERVTFLGKYTYDPADPDWVQGFSSEEVRRENGDLLYEGYWFCPSNPWLDWNGPSYMCRENYSVNERFASAYQYKYYYNDYTHWVRNNSLTHVKRVPRSARFASIEQRQQVSNLFDNFNPYSQQLESKVSITKPGEYKMYPTSFDRIEINVENSQTLLAPTGLIQLQWRRISKGPDAIGGVTLSSPPDFWEWPTNGPEYLRLVDGSGWINGESGYFNNNQKGLYQVRARFADEELAEWSKPVRFWIGTPQFATDNMTMTHNYFSETNLNDIGVKNNLSGYTLLNGSQQTLEVVPRETTTRNPVNPPLRYLNYLSGISALNMSTEIIDTRSESLKLSQAHDVYFDLGNEYAFSEGSEGSEEETRKTRVRLSCIPIEKCKGLSTLLPGQPASEGAAKLLKLGLPGLGLDELELSKIRVLIILDNQEEEKIIRQLAK